MTVLEVGLGLGLAMSLIWWAATYLLLKSKIEEIEDELEECDNEIERKLW